MERPGVVTPRSGDVAVLGAAALGGLLFGPVFGLLPLLVPIGAVVLVTFGVTELGRRRPGLIPWRPVFAVVAGLLAVVETVLPATTAAGIPTGESVAVLAEGAVHGWQLTLQSTWPARPEPRLLAFVPLAVLLAAVLGIEVLHRLRRPLLALVPGLLVLVLSQAYVAVTGVAAVATGLGYAAIAGLALAGGGGAGWPRLLKLSLPAVVLGVAGALALTVADPLAKPAYSLKDDESVPLTEDAVVSPLSEVAYRSKNPAPQVFRHTGDTPASNRWPLAVLDGFDGSNWFPGGGFRRMGAEIAPGSDIEVPVTRRQAAIEVTGSPGPWLPGQASPASVTGIDVLVDEARGTLVAGRPVPSIRYTLAWWEPEVGAAALLGAGMARGPHGGLGGLGTVPPAIDELADRVLPTLRPSFQTAVALERHLAENYRLATGDDLPTGHGWPQLSRFLLEDKRGTSEQFAAAYVVLARLKGIPARLVVGYRVPERAEAEGVRVVRNADILAWPEVAVDKVGWIPLDPAGAAKQSGTGSASGIAAAVAEVRTQLPPEQKLQNPELPPGESEEDEPEAGAEWGTAAIVVAIGLAGLVVLWGAGVPAVTGVRAWRRRRRLGRAGVIAAWAEARDRLRAHGVPVTAGMTVRDLATSAAVFGQQSTVDGLGALARSVDAALWSGAAPDVAGEAWASVAEVRTGLKRRPWRARLRAAVDGRVLFPPRGG
ncbi:transglutaminaseTgpA domain-containing protein [Amycolatopsis sp. QT-25]|uniref:transglutaminase family protein n=1 Tax=Amycolatopsis sp. QT-25 TaxID=3034022 RepID=UPI0023EB8324|nr:transglutaminase domain-containing protein [Amycolatopsis sp. QT-25]WET82416.1 transglutaminaseTgpA domain-containing protein [Amycolatopsis sp. QT-25]